MRGWRRPVSHRLSVEWALQLEGSTALERTTSSAYHQERISQSRGNSTYSYCYPPINSIRIPCFRPACLSEYVALSHNPEALLMTLPSVPGITSLHQFQPLLFQDPHACLLHGGSMRDPPIPTSPRSKLPEWCVPAPLIFSHYLLHSWDQVFYVVCIPV